MKKKSNYVAQMKQWEQKCKKRKKKQRETQTEKEDG